MVRDSAELERLVRSSVGGIEGVLEVESLREARVHRLRFEIPPVLPDGSNGGEPRG